MTLPSGQTHVVLLGPVSVVVDGETHSVPRSQTRGVLALLALSPRRALSRQAVVSALWGDAAPPTARAQVNNAMREIRRLFAGLGVVGAVESGQFGYRLTVDPALVDAVCFEQLVKQARTASAAGDEGQANRLLRAGLDLWTSEPLLDAAGAFVESTRTWLSDARLTAIEDLADLDLRHGRPELVAAELAPLVRAHPMRERLRSRLMLALYLSGRRSDALQIYREYRQALAEQEGLDPGASLAELERQILRGDPSLSPPAAPPKRPLLRHRVPAQLPPDVRGFAGRADDLHRLDGLLDEAAQHPNATVVCAITGTAGVGKTALAVHWARRIRENFPDGQLYVNLRGFDPDGAAMTPGEAIHRFLDAFGVPPARVPVDLDAQTSLYRSELDGKRVLILLDNVRDAGQVRPLLPGTATALTLVTSRSQLSSLVAVNGAVPLALDQLTDDDARQLLSGRLGAARLAAEPAAVDEIITRCARLPLALTIAATRATRPELSLAAVAADLADAGGRLDMLSAGDAVSEVRTVLSWSYDALTPAAAELFRLLGLHPGTDISVPAAASLIGTPAPQALSLLAELTRAGLLTEQAAGRYAFHDLLRVYAGELAHSREPDERRREATDRLLDHYLHTAHAADRLLNPSRDPIAPKLPEPRPGVTPEVFAGHTSAMAWLTAERPVLVAAAEQAAQAGHDVYVWQLAWALTTFLTRQGPWHHLTTTWRLALDAARRLDDLSLQADAHRYLGQTHTELRDFPEADDRLRQALDLYGKTGDPIGKAVTHQNLATLHERQGDAAQALDQVRLAHIYFKEAGHGYGQAATLNAMGWYHCLLDDHEEALAHGRLALALLRELENRHSEADAWDTVGFAHHHLRQYDQALACYRHALALYREIGDRYYEAGTLIRVGDTHEATRDRTAAVASWQHALVILNDLRHPEIDTVVARLQSRSPGDLPAPGE
ncbi:MAG TPA: BTAD domain-containing putative transcriptional regulator [Candidatus Limnocylindrales bacterium]